MQIKVDVIEYDSRPASMGETDSQIRNAEDHILWRESRLTTSLFPREHLLLVGAGCPLLSRYGQDPYFSIFISGVITYTSAG